MEVFENRIKISNEQKKEVIKYLNSITITGEDAILALVRKLKMLDQKIEDNKYD